MKEILLYAVGPLGIFLTAPILARGLGPAGRGEFGVAQAVASFALALGALGQAEVYIADRRLGRGDFNAASRVAMCGGIFFAILAVFGMMALGVTPAVAIVVALLIPVLSQSQLWRSAAVASGEISRPAYNNALAAVLRVLFLVVLSALALLSVGSAIGAVQLAAALGAMLTIGHFALRKHGVGRTSGGWKDELASLTRGAPLLLFSLFTAVTLRSDLVVLQIVSTPEEVGIYAAVSALTLSVLAVSGAFKTRVQSALFSRSPRRGVHREMYLVLALGAVGATLGVVLAPVLVAILLGPGYEGAVELLCIMSIAAAGLLVLDVVHASLVVLSMRRQLIWVSACGAAVTVLSLVLLVPVHGAAGAAFASLISYWTAACIGWAVVENHLKRRGALS